MALNLSPLTDEEIKEIEKIRKELGKEFCRRCNYCQPCPQEIPIWVILHADSAMKRLPLSILKSGWFYDAYQKVKTCIKCAICVTRCPYNLPIPDMIEKKIEVIRAKIGS